MYVVTDCLLLDMQGEHISEHQVLPRAAIILPTAIHTPVYQILIPWSVLSLHIMKERLTSVRI